MEKANLAIGAEVTEAQAAAAKKYARRRRMRQIDFLIDELEMLNLKDETVIPDRLRDAIQGMLAEFHFSVRFNSIAEAMDLLYDLQAHLMPFGERDRD